MAIAYTNLPIIKTDIRGDTVSNFLADIHTVATQVGWSGTATTSGWVYTLTSPQSLSCHVVTVDNGDGRAKIQFTSLDGTPGYAHHIRCGDPAYEAHGYHAVVGVCQLFLSLHDITTEQLNIFIPRDYSVAGGIPFIPDSSGADCIASAGINPPITDIWWSCGQADNTPDFRATRMCTGAYSHCLNSTVTVRDESYGAGAYSGSLRLYPLTLTEDADAWYITQPRTVKYSSGDPMYLHPWIGWDYAIQGQLWDAFLVSRDTPLESTITSGAETWLGWNYGLVTRGGGGTYYATLYLLVAQSASLANYAY